MSSVAKLFDSAVAAHRAGRLDQAQKLYQDLLVREPRHADALNLSGLLASQTGNPGRAMELLRAAIAIDPNKPPYYTNLAEAHRALGQFAAAIECYLQALRLAPNVFESQNNLGTLYQTIAQYEPAIACYLRAIAMRPTDTDCQFNLSTALHRQGKLHAAAEGYEKVLKLSPDHFRALMNLGGIRTMERALDVAQQCYERAIRLVPNDSAVHYNLGNVFQGQGRYDGAIACYRRALELDATNIDALCNLGSALHEQRKLEPALHYLTQARDMRPDYAVPQCNLGVVLQDLGRLEEARQCFQRACELQPGTVEFIYNLGTALRDLGDIAGAVAQFDQALAIDPKYGQALCTRGTSLLSAGRLREGWAGYEHRVGLPQFNTQSFPKPQWDGTPLAGRKLLVHCEQGMGDCLQFIRYLNVIRDAAPDAILSTPRELFPLFMQSGFRHLAPNDEPLPEFDVHAPLMSLPYILRTELESIPHDVPYLAADSARLEYWRGELAAYPGLRVGIVWQGKANYRGDRKRSMPLSMMAPLARVPGVQLFSLQKGFGSEQLPPLAQTLGIVDLGSRIDNSGGAFLDSAAVISQLDLMISTDTGIAHLAGGLAARTWVALSTLCDWRWLMQGDTCPWYPTMRLFRQTALDDWPGVIARMVAALEELKQAPR